MSAACPECAGPWLYTLTFRHGPGCSLGAAQDATRAADAERIRRRGGEALTRPSTAAEVALIAQWRPEDATASEEPQTSVEAIAETVAVLRLTVDGIAPPYDTVVNPDPTEGDPS